MSFEYAGATVEIVDATTILAAARVNPVELLRRATFPAPVRRVGLTVTSADTGSGPVHVFIAEIRTNDDDVPHTVTSSTKVFKSPPLDTGETFTYTFKQAGTFEYYCALHPHMTGKVVVK